MEWYEVLAWAAFILVSVYALSAVVGLVFGIRQWRKFEREEREHDRILNGE